MKRKYVLNAAAVLVVLAGLTLLLYPMVSNSLYQKKLQEQVAFYDNQTKELPEETINFMWEDCRRYNEELLNENAQLTDPFANERNHIEAHPYVDLLNTDGNGIMGSLEIPAIDCRLQIYHGTEEDVLAKGVGHLQGTSLPVGGTGAHAVLSAHTGAADRKLFTDLDQLKEGDVFYLHILGDILAYQVDQIQVVLPGETESLVIDREKDLVTLVTCTPYGINTHRLLVRGVRVDYEQDKAAEADRKGNAGSTWINQYAKAILVGILLAAALAAAGFLISRIIKKKKRGHTS